MTKTTKKLAGAKQPSVFLETEMPKTTEDLSAKCKLAMMCLMIARLDGATLVDLSKALGWKERSIRGSISNMLKKGIIKKIYSKKLDAERTYFAKV